MSKRVWTGTMRRLHPARGPGKILPAVHFGLLLQSLGLRDRFVTEFEFAKPERKFRADFADVTSKILVEVEGGICARQTGAHVRGKHYQSDCVKYNLATTLGWRVLRYTTVESMRTFESDYRTILDADRKETEAEHGG